MFLQNIFSSGAKEVSKEGNNDDLAKSLSGTNKITGQADDFNKKLQENIKNNNQKQIDTKQTESNLEAASKGEGTANTAEYSTQTNILSDAVESSAVTQVTLETTSKTNAINTNNSAETVLTNGKILPENSSRSGLQLPIDINNSQTTKSQTDSLLSPLASETKSPNPAGVITNLNTAQSTDKKSSLELSQQSIKTEGSQITTKLDLTTQNKSGVDTPQATNSLTNKAIEQGSGKLQTADKTISDSTGNKLAQGQTAPTAKADVTSVNLQADLTNQIKQENTAPVINKVDSISDKIQQSQNGAVNNSTKASEARAGAPSGVLLQDGADTVALKKVTKEAAQTVSQTLSQSNQTPRVEIPAITNKSVKDVDAKSNSNEFKFDTKLSLKGAVEISPENKVVNNDKVNRTPIARLLGIGAVSPLASADTSLQSTATQHATGTETYNTARLDSTTNQSPSLASTREIPLPVHVPRNIWNQRFAEHISMLTLKGASQARIKLDPPELGPMMVRIIHGAETQIQFTVNNPIARDLVDSGMQRLRELLEQQGFDQVDVDVREFKQESHAEGRAADDFDETEIAHLSGQTNNLAPDAKPIETYRESIGIIDIFA